MDSETLLSLAVSDIGPRRDGFPAALPGGGISAALTLWSMIQYLRAAWPHLARSL